MRVHTPKGIITLFVVVLAVLVFSVMPAAAQSQGTMRFSPDTISLREGESALIEVWIYGALDVYGCDVVVGFDASNISVSNIQPGGFLESGFVITSKVDNDKGRLEYAATQVAPSQPKSGEGVLFKFTVTAIGGGESQVKFSRSTISLMDGTLVTLGKSSAVITVIEPTPIPTLVPTPAPIYIPPTPAPTVAEPMATPTEIQMIQPSSTNLPKATQTSEPATPTESPAVTVTPTPVLATPETGLTQADQAFLNVMWWSLLGGMVSVIILLAWRTFKPNAKK
jgi:hypothetical protein